MSQENVEVFRRFADAQNRRDVESMLDELDAEVEWHPATVGSLGGEATVFRGHIGIRELFRDLYEAFGVSRAGYWEIRDLGDRIVALGHWITRGGGSGAETATPLGFVADFRNGKLIRVWSLPRSPTGPRGRGAAGVGDVAGERRSRATTRCARWRSWRAPRRLFLDRLPSLKAPEVPGRSRASLVGQHVVVVLDDIRVRRCVDQRVVLIGGLLAVVAPAEPAEGSPDVHLRPLPSASQARTALRGRLREISGFALLSRTTGLLGHLAEVMERPPRARRAP